MALCLCASWITAEAGFDWTEEHFLLGYCSLTLIVFRIIWGIVGPTHARFSQFIKGPRTTLRAVPKLLNRNPSTSSGHNPIGGWSTVVMLGLVGVQVCTGLFISDDIFYAGPYNGVVSSSLADTMASIHHNNFLILQITVAVHLVAIAWYTLGKRTNLVTPMFSGKKALPQEQGSEAISSSQILKAVVIFAVVATLVTLLVQLAPPPPVDDYF